MNRAGGSTLFDIHDERISGADFSACRTFRYALWRRWKNLDSPRLVAFIGVNPSVANEHDNDRTISRCIGFAKLWGYDGMLMLNAFAHIQTKLGTLKLSHEHIGETNNETILRYKDDGALMVAAWGVNCPQWRQVEIQKLLGRDLYCMGTNSDGTPKHPLFLKSTVALEVFWRAKEETA